ncbi:hypothetical protein BDR26DRAFT_930750 [Obelidium mucronatum]|nr:hypothetical protein BDR26DRAFT_930750 [Obelidium mucronatum]
MNKLLWANLPASHAAARDLDALENQRKAALKAIREKKAPKPLGLDSTSSISLPTSAAPNNIPYETGDELSEDGGGDDDDDAST